MRKVYEIIMVIVAAGLAAAVALIEIPTRSAPGPVVAGGDLFAAPPPTSPPTLPPLPPLLFPPDSSPPIPVGSPATPAPALSLGPQPPRGVTEASSPAMGIRGASLAQHAPTSATGPPSATKPKPPPTSNRPKPPPPIKPKPPPTSNKPKPPPRTKPKPPPTSEKPKVEPPTKPKSKIKAEASGSTTSAGASSSPPGSAADQSMAA